MEIGVPSVFPSNVPDIICTRSASLRGVTMADCPWPVAVKIRLNIGLDQSQARRATIDDHADATPVRFSPGGNAKQLSERISHPLRLEFGPENSKPKSSLAKIAKMGIFNRMIVTATELANESKSILDRVVQGGEFVEIQRHGKTVAVIQPKVGASRAELLRLLRDRGFSDADSKVLKKAMDAASEIIGYAGCD